jgi:hypothetical protein
MYLYEKHLPDVSQNIMLLYEHKDILYKTYILTVKHINLLIYRLSLGYMFRLLRVIVRPSTELNQVYLTTSALWDPVVLKICAKTGVHVNQTDIV